MSRRKGRTTVFRQNIPAVNIINSAEVQTVADTSVDSAFANMSGIVFAYAANTPPTGWLLCNGSAVSRTVYAELFARIGTSHGIGDNLTTFNLPDYRGRFLRGRDAGVGRDDDRALRTAMNSGGSQGDSVGSVQGHQFASHTHIQNAHSHSVNYNGLLTFSGGGGFANTFWGGSIANQSTNANTATNQNTGGSETRPVNAYVNYIIKI